MDTLTTIIFYLGDEPVSGVLTAEFANETDFSASEVEFVSLDPDVATIAADYDEETHSFTYVVTPVSIGETYIYAKIGDGKICSARRKVVVKEYIPVETVILGEDCTLEKGKSIKIACEVAPENATEPSVTWTSSDESVATVSADGTVKAINYGAVDITAETSNGISDTCEITVVKTMRCSISRVRNDGNNIGNEWSHSAYIVNEPLTDGKIELYPGKELEFYCKSVEDDIKPDVGESTETHTVTEEDLTKGFTVEVEVTVTENAGKNYGKSAEFVVTFTFTP